MKLITKNSQLDVRAIFYSLLLHLVLIFTIFLGADFFSSNKKINESTSHTNVSYNQVAKTGEIKKIVSATAVTSEQVEKQAAVIRSQREQAAKEREQIAKAEQAKIARLQKQARELEQAKKLESQRLQKLKEQQAKDALLARKEQENRIKQEKQRLDALRKEQAQKQAELQKIEQAKAKQAQAAANAITKAQQELKKKEQAAKNAAAKAAKEQEKLKKLELERREQEAALNNLFSELTVEHTQNTQAMQKMIADQVQIQGEIYKQLIQSKLIKAEYLIGKSCQVNINLIATATGMLVSDVNILSGDPQVCSATRRAIAQVGEFPKHNDEAVTQQLKVINVTVDLN